MPQNILIATLGDHPAVVTGMVKALREFEKIEIDTLHVLHPQDTGKYIGREGMSRVAEHLDGICDVCSERLPFADPNTYQTSLVFLQTLTALLGHYSNREQYHVYLSLAGGRKNMSALMALTTQFFPAVRGLYHLLDKREGKRDAAFPSIKEIELSLSPDEARAAMDPPLEQLNLIPIPYPGAFAESSQLWRFLKSSDTAPVSPIPLTPAAETFYRDIFQPARAGHSLQVWLSKTAYERYRQWADRGNNYAREFMTCFKQMRDPVLLKSRMHGTFGEFHFYKRRRTRERPFYYTRPNPIHLYPREQVDQVVVCGLAVEQGDGQYDPPADELLKDDHQPYKRLAELDTRDCVLLVPLGKSPMIATQTYTLLRNSETEGCPRIPVVAVLYPQRSAPIRNGMHLLEKQFKRQERVEFVKYPIAELSDVDSEQTCRVYLSELLSTIADLKLKYPDREIALSFSGGRKGMAALTLFAAQRAGIERLYHTLITDLELEERITRETTYDELQGLATDRDRARRLFLDEYGQENLTLFTIPIIPFTR